MHKLLTWGLLPLTLLLSQCGTSPQSTVSSDVSSEISLAPADASEPVQALQMDPCNPDEQQPNGSVYRFCVPRRWRPNERDLLVYVPGYVDPFRPVEIPEEQFVITEDLPSIPEIANAVGFAFATSSFPSNGIVPASEGIPDLVQLLETFTQTYGEPRFTYILAGSLGNLVVAPFVEVSPPVVDGGILACGPIGDFQAEIDYIGDARVLFDYYFPDVLPGNFLSVPDEVVQNWETVYVPRIQAAFEQDPVRTYEYLNVAGIRTDQRDLERVAADVVNLLFFHVFGMEEATERVGGAPYGNRGRRYRGSQNDADLNARVQRITASFRAQQTLTEVYEVVGIPRVPVVTLFNVGDAVVPYNQQRLYRQKVQATSQAELLRNVPSFAYGHCEFTVPSLVAAVGIVVLQVTGQELPNPERVLTDPRDLAEYRRLLQTYGRW